MNLTLYGVKGRAREDRVFMGNFTSILDIEKVLGLWGNTSAIKAYSVCSDEYATDDYMLYYIGDSCVRRFTKVNSPMVDMSASMYELSEGVFLTSGEVYFYRGTDGLAHAGVTGMLVTKKYSPNFLGKYVNYGLLNDVKISILNSDRYSSVCLDSLLKNYVKVSSVKYYSLFGNMYLMDKLEV